MPSFGFLGPFPGPFSFEAAAERGHAFARAQKLPAMESRVDATGAVWAPHTAGEDGILVAVDGSPALPGVPGTARAVLDAYRRDGVRFLSSLRGRFALAIVDGPAKRVLLAIDRMGIERLTFAVRDSGVVFSSSAEAVAAFPPIRAPLNNQALYDYLLLHMVPAPDTVYQGVSKLLAGTYVLFENGTVRSERWWQPRFAERGSFERLKNELRETLRTGVRSTQPDGRTGAFLSGGLDSSSVAGVLSEVSPGNARTFSIGFSYPQYDERAYARIANEHFGCAGHEYVVDGKDIAATFPLIARAYDEPFGNSSALPVYYCARMAREHGVEHLLAGDGGDELFAGNSRYAEQQIFERYKLVPSPVRRRLLEPLLACWPNALTFWPVRKARGYVSKANTPLPARLESWNLVNQVGVEEFLHPDFRAAIDPQAPFVRMQQVWDSAGESHTLNHMLFYDWQYTLANNDLRKVESMSALAGVRVSYPMLHDDVIDMSLRVPPSLMMPGMKLRHFYKQAMQGWLPEAIINKKKHGFGLPFGLWLQDSPELRELIAARLSSMRSRRVVNPRLIDKLLQLHRHENASFYGVFVWVIAMLEQWFDEHHVAPAI